MCPPLFDPIPSYGGGEPKTNTLSDAIAFSSQGITDPSGSNQGKLVTFTSSHEEANPTLPSYQFVIDASEEYLKLVKSMKVLSESCAVFVIPKDGKKEIPPYIKEKQTIIGDFRKSWHVKIGSSSSSSSSGIADDNENQEFKWHIHKTNEKISFVNLVDVVRSMYDIPEGVYEFTCLVGNDSDKKGKTELLFLEQNSIESDVTPSFKTIRVKYITENDTSIPTSLVGSTIMHSEEKPEGTMLCDDVYEDFFKCNEKTDNNSEEHSLQYMFDSFDHKKVLQGLPKLLQMESKKHKQLEKMVKSIQGFNVGTKKSPDPKKLKFSKYFLAIVTIITNFIDQSKDDCNILLIMLTWILSSYSNPNSDSEIIPSSNDTIFHIFEFGIPDICSYYFSTVFKLHLYFSPGTLDLLNVILHDRGMLSLSLISEKITIARNTDLAGSDVYDFLIQLPMKQQQRQIGTFHNVNLTFVKDINEFRVVENKYGLSINFHRDQETMLFIAV